MTKRILYLYKWNRHNRFTYKCGNVWYSNGTKPFEKCGFCGSTQHEVKYKNRVKSMYRAVLTTLHEIEFVV